MQSVMDIRELERQFHCPDYRLDGQRHARRHEQMLGNVYLAKPIDAKELLRLVGEWTQA